MSEEQPTQPSAEEITASERQFSIKRAQELAGRARGALSQVAGHLDGVPGMEQLHKRAMDLALEVELTLLNKIK